MLLAEHRAQSAYGAAAAPIKSPRDTEYEVIGRISHRLRNAAVSKTADYPGFVAAISANRRLWTTLAVDVCQPENLLSQDLRARILWLAEFTEYESRRLLRGDGDVAVLIEINAALMHGLRSQEAPE